MRLFDYNRDGHIQRHELRRVLENFCFKLSDVQFNKLVQSSPGRVHGYKALHKYKIKSGGFVVNGHEVYEATLALGGEHCVTALARFSHI